jgi:hypothetical protein
MNHVVAFSLLGRTHAQLLGQFSCGWFSEHLANPVCFLSVLFISLGYCYIIFNNTNQPV